MKKTLALFRESFDPMQVSSNSSFSKTDKRTVYAWKSIPAAFKRALQKDDLVDICIKSLATLIDEIQEPMTSAACTGLSQCMLQCFSHKGVELVLESLCNLIARGLVDKTVIAGSMSEKLVESIIQNKQFLVSRWSAQVFVDLLTKCHKNLELVTEKIVNQLCCVLKTASDVQLQMIIVEILFRANAKNANVPLKQSFLQINKANFIKDCREYLKLVNESQLPSTFALEKATYKQTSLVQSKECDLSLDFNQNTVALIILKQSGLVILEFYYSQIISLQLLTSLNIELQGTLLNNTRMSLSLSLNDSNAEKALNLLNHQQKLLKKASVATSLFTTSIDKATLVEPIEQQETTLVFEDYVQEEPVASEQTSSSSASSQDPDTVVQSLAATPVSTKQPTKSTPKRKAPTSQLTTRLDTKNKVTSRDQTSSYQLQIKRPKHSHDPLQMSSMFSAAFEKQAVVSYR